jgi:hypothetical protein
MRCAATAVPDARETALVSLPGLNGEQRAPVANTAVPNARETAVRALTRALGILRGSEPPNGWSEVYRTLAQSGFRPAVMMLCMMRCSPAGDDALHITPGTIST